MKLIFSDHSTVDLCIQDNALGKLYNKIYKNLSRATLIFREWDNPCYLDRLTYSQLVDKLEFYAHQVNIVIDRSRALAQEQPYFNKIHKIYEMNYNGGPGWLDFHEHIHLCETYYKSMPRMLDIDYREKAGMLEQPFDLAWLKDCTPQIRAGAVFVNWAELGKTPYFYWSNREPEDLDRLCRLAKPWLKLRPRIKIALEDFDSLKDKELDQFKLWWTKYEADWCHHWNLTSWTVEDMFSNAVIGHIPDLDAVKTLLHNNIHPIGVSMS